MNQTDKIIIVIIVFATLIGLGMLNCKYIPQISKHNAKIASLTEAINFASTNYWNNVRKPGNVRSRNDHKKELTSKLLIVIFGNIGILVCAGGTAYFLRPRKRY